MAGPLEGTRVLVLAGMGPVSYVSMLLADLGADVVRVTRPATRSARALTQTEGLTDQLDVANRGVGAITVDLKDPAGVETVLDLVASADVFVEGFRPGVVERLGVGPNELLDRNPRLVYARLTGYGQSGPRAQHAGHDINYVAQSGVLHALAREGEAPHPPINLLGDYAGGGTIAALGVVSALVSVGRTGEGQVIDAAMVDGVALLSAKIQGLRAAGAFSDEPGTNFLDTGAPFYDSYSCADGRYLAVGALESNFYAAFVAGLGLDIAALPEQNDPSGWPQLRQAIGDAVASRPLAHWERVFTGTDACVSPVLTFDEAARDAHNAVRGLYTKVDGTLHPAPAPRFSATPSREPEAPRPGRSEPADVASRWSDAPNSGTDSI